MTPPSQPSRPDLNALELEWRQWWPTALSHWSSYTRLNDPLFLHSHADAIAAGLSGSFACINLHNHRVLINLQEIDERGLQPFALEILSHEIGHHVYAPGDLTDNARLLARTRLGLPNVEAHAPMIANLYTDLLINDRLQREASLDMASVFVRLEQKAMLDRQSQEAIPSAAPGQLWQFYLRTYELLWSLREGSLVAGPLPAHMQADAWLGSRLIRVYHRDWLDGSGRFAALCLPYLLKDLEAQASSPIALLMDATRANGDALPDGLVQIDAAELEGNLHPIHDPRLNDLLDALAASNQGSDQQGRPLDNQSSQQKQDGKHGSLEQGDPETSQRSPLGYAELLKSLGIDITPLDAAVRYYRERARPYRIPFPVRQLPNAVDEHPEGLAGWEPGDPIERLDYLSSILQNPLIIPGVTTLTRLTGAAPGHEPQRQPVDLDIYVDCSGSMPNPQQAVSYTTLASTIIALSALRVGARVKATLWSGEGQAIVTDGFVRDERQILRVVAGYIGGGTAFPIGLLHKTIAARKPSDRRLHTLIISDDGISTLFEGKAGKLKGATVAQQALTLGQGGGTLLLQLASKWQDYPFLQLAAQQGWQIWTVSSLSELIVLAREFSTRHYQSSSCSAPAPPHSGQRAAKRN